MSPPPPIEVAPTEHHLPASVPGRAAALKATLPCIGLVVLAAVWCFAPALDNEFLTWDDDQTFSTNPDIRGLSMDHLRRMSTSHRMGVWQPLSWFIAAVQYRLFGQSGEDAFCRGVHGTSIALHALASALTFLVIRRLVVFGVPRSAARSPVGLNLGATVAALLFAVHPLRVEVVAWASAQMYILSYIGAVGAIWCYLGVGQARSWKRHIPVLLCLAASLACKATAIPLIAVFMVLDIYPLRRVGGAIGWKGANLSRLLLEKIPYLVVTIPVIFLAVWATYADRALLVSKPALVDAPTRLLAASHCMMFGVTALLAPVKLAPLYLRPSPFDKTDPWFVGAAMAFLIITVLVVLLRRRAPWLLAAWAAHVLILLPVSGLGSHGAQLVADRYTYLSSIGWLTLIAAGVLRLWAGRQKTLLRTASIMVVVGTLVVLVRMSRQYNSTWKDSVSVWRAMVDRDPGFAMGHYNLARALRVRGDHEAALRRLRRTLELQPSHTDANVDLGSMLEGAGDKTAAEIYYRAALRSRPGYYLAHMNLAYLRMRQKRYAEAIDHFTLARTDAERSGTTYILELIDHYLPKARAAAESPRPVQP